MPKLTRRSRPPSCIGNCPQSPRRMHLPISMASTRCRIDQTRRSVGRSQSRPQSRSNVRSRWCGEAPVLWCGTARDNRRRRPPFCWSAWQDLLHFWPSPDALSACTTLLTAFAGLFLGRDQEAIAVLRARNPLRRLTAPTPGRARFRISIPWRKQAHVAPFSNRQLVAMPTIEEIH